MNKAKRIRLVIIFMLIFGSCNSYGEKIMIKNVHRLKTLKQEFRIKIETLLQWAKENIKDDITIACAYRSPIMQNLLYLKGNKTTTLRGGQSKHQHGLAVDLYFIRNNKIVPYNEDYKRLGEHAESLGITWGGRWKIPFDPGHFEGR